MFNFTKDALEKDLPAAGQHQATITRINISDKGDIVYAVFDLRLADGTIIPDILTIKASKESGRQDEMRKGVKRVRDLAAASGKSADTIKTADDMINQFTGASVTVTIAHGSRDGVLTPMIKAFAPPKPAAASAAVAKA